MVWRTCSDEAFEVILMAYLRVQSCNNNLASRVTTWIKDVGCKCYSNVANGFIALIIKKVRSLA